MPKGTRIRLIVLAVVVVVLAIVITALLSRTTYGVLYYGMTTEEAGAIADALTAMNVSYQMEGTSTILVPENQVNDLKAQLAFEGLSSSSDFSYDIFAQSSGFGTTDLEKQTYKQYQDQSHICTQLNTLDKVDNSWVIIAPASSSKYALSTDSDTSGVAVVLKLNSSLTDGESAQIANLVATAAKVDASTVVIMDTSMRTYYSGGESGIGGGTQVEQQIALQEQAARAVNSQVEQLLIPVVGYDHMRVSATVLLNFDKEVSESIEYSPPVAGSEEGMIRSVEKALELQRYYEDAEGVVGTDSNGLGTVEYPYGDLADSEVYKQAMETTNYELNQVITQIEKAQGGIKHISLSVLLDSNTVANDSTLLESLSAAVQTATNVPADMLTVALVPFTEAEEDIMDTATDFAKAEQRNQLIKTIVTALLVALLVVAAFLLLRTLLQVIGTSSKSAAVAAITAGMPGTGGKIDLVAGDGTPLEDIDLTQKPENLQQLEKFIDRDPAAVASLLRNWLGDDY